MYLNRLYKLWSQNYSQHLRGELQIEYLGKALRTITSMGKYDHLAYDSHSVEQYYFCMMVFYYWDQPIRILKWGSFLMENELILK